MKKVMLYAFISALSLGVCLTSSAQVGSTTGKLVKEVIELIVKKGGKESLEELTEFGGEVVVKETLEKAAREGGEDLVQAVVRSSRIYGLDGLKAVAESPKLMTKALDALPSNLKLKGVTEASRNPKLITQLVQEYGDEGLEVAAKHPGVGSKVISEFGEAGVKAGKVLSTDDLIILSRQKKAFSALPPQAKADFIEILKNNPKVVLTYLAGGTGILLTADAVNEIKKITIGNSDEPGPVIKPIIFWAWVLPAAIILILVVVFLPKLFGMRNRERIKTKVAQAKGDKDISDINGNAK
jgi:hypothetical protein